MLPAAERLRRRSDFAATVRAGRRASRGAVLVHLAGPSAQPTATSAETASPPGARVRTRAGFVVPKTVGGAVARNRVLRRLRHLVRERIPGLPPGMDIVVRALPSATSRTYQQLGADLDGALAAARARRPRAAGGRQTTGGR